MSLTFLYKSLVIEDKMKVRMTNMSDLWQGKLGEPEKKLGG